MRKLNIIAAKFGLILIRRSVESTGIHYFAWEGLKPEQTLRIAEIPWQELREDVNYFDDYPFETWIDKMLTIAARIYTHIDFNFESKPEMYQRGRYAFLISLLPADIQERVLVNVSRQALWDEKDMEVVAEVSFTNLVTALRVGFRPEDSVEGAEYWRQLTSYILNGCA